MNNLLKVYNSNLLYGWHFLIKTLVLFVFGVFQNVGKCPIKMADEPDNDDQWLYGDNPDGKLPEPETEPRKSPEQPPAEEPPQENEAPTEVLSLPKPMS